MNLHFCSFPEGKYNMTIIDKSVYSRLPLRPQSGKIKIRVYPLSKKWKRTSVALIKHSSFSQFFPFYQVCEKLGGPDFVLTSLCFRKFRHAAVYQFYLICFFFILTRFNWHFILEYYWKLKELMKQYDIVLHARCWSFSDYQKNPDFKKKYQ